MSTTENANGNNQDGNTNSGQDGLLSRVNLAGFRGNIVVNPRPGNTGSDPYGLRHIPNGFRGSLIVNLPPVPQNPHPRRRQNRSRNRRLRRLPPADQSEANGHIAEIHAANNIIKSQERRIAEFDRKIQEIIDRNSAHDEAAQDSTSGNQGQETTASSNGSNTT